MAVAYADVVPMGPTVADQVLEAGRSLAQSQYRLVVLAAEFDESDEWWCSGAGTAAHWLAAQLDVCVSTAREWIRIGKALRGLPAIAGAFERRELTYAQVRALTRVADAGSEGELVALARAVPAGRLGHALAAWSQCHEDGAARDDRHRRDRSLRHRVEADGMVTITLRLPPEGAQAVLMAIEATMMRRAHDAKPPVVAEPITERGQDASADASGDSLAQQRADALVDQRLVPPPPPLGPPAQGGQGTRPMLCGLRRHRAPRVRPRPPLHRDRPHRHRRTQTPLRPLPPTKARSGGLAGIASPRPRHRHRDMACRWHGVPSRPSSA